MRIDEKTKTMRVGPESAGAVPGPVCYGRGGTVPTVTDADLVLGMIDADEFRRRAHAARPRQAPSARSPRSARRLGMSALECAAGIAKIVEFQMADIIRKMTVGKGFDPRDFVLFAFGGAGPVHAGVFARELGVAKVVIPQRETASVWCAFGAASADVLHIHEAVDIQASPFDGSAHQSRRSSARGQRAGADGARTASPPRASASNSRSTCATRARSTRSRWSCRGAAPRASSRSR